jgi:hypothetical protein
LNSSYEIMNTTATTTTTTNLFDNTKIYFTQNPIDSTTATATTYFDTINCLVNDTSTTTIPQQPTTNGLSSSSNSSSSSISSSHYHNYHDNIRSNNYLTIPQQQQQQQPNMLTTPSTSHLHQTQLNYNTNFLTNLQHNVHYFNNLNDLNHKITPTNSNIDNNNIGNNEIIDFSMKCDNNYKLPTSTAANNNYHRPIQQQQQDLFYNNTNSSFQVNHQRVHHQPIHFQQPHLQQQQQQLLRMESPPPSILNEIINDNDIIDDDIENMEEDDDDDDDIDDSDLLIDTSTNVDNQQQLYSKSQFHDHASFDLMSYNNNYNVTANTNGNGYDSRYGNDRKLLNDVNSYNHLPAAHHHNSHQQQQQQQQIHLSHNVIQNDILNLNGTSNHHLNSNTNSHQNLMDLLAIDSFKPEICDNRGVLQTNNYIDVNNMVEVKSVKKSTISTGVIKTTNDSFKHSITKSKFFLNFTQILISV